MNNDNTNIAAILNIIGNHSSYDGRIRLKLAEIFSRILNRRIEI